MAFDANRDIKIEASETSPGVYQLRTRGLADKRRPELEIAAVPEAGLNAAGGVINIVAEYAVNKAEILADQSVGNVLTVGDRGRKLLLVVRAIASERPKAGLWSKLVGGGKGVLRLVDVTGGDSDAPRTALATMLVHRAAVRLAKDDDEGAREELLAAIAVFPGDAGTGQPPSIGGADGVLNWQNHLAYLELARLAADDIDEAAGHFGSALERSDELARREIGAAPAAVASLSDADVTRAAKRIIEHNLGSRPDTSGPATGLVTLASPIWELTDDDRSVRRASLLPRSLVALYYEGATAERLTRDGASLVTTILGRDREAPWRPAWIARETRGIWISNEAPFLEPIGPAQRADGVVSSVLADIARCFRADATNEEILARYGARGPEPFAEVQALDAKLAVLAEWESEEYMATMSQ
jgi:hypothetical protein